MARIGISILSKAIGGPRTYAINLVKELLTLDRKNEYQVYCDNRELLPALDGARVTRIPMASRYGRPLWDQMQLPAFLKRHGIDLYHSTKNVIPFLRPRVSVVTIHDLAPLVFPETFTRLQRLHLRFHIPWATRLSSIVITDSSHSREDLVERLDVPRSKIRVIPLGVSSIFGPVTDPERLDAVRSTFGIPEPAIMYVGTLQPRKNLDILLHAFSQLRREFSVPHRLVLVGRKGWMYETLRKETSRLGLENDVVFTGVVSDEELPAVICCAEIFVSPSSYEGFGLSVLEAMACGVPVVTSNVSSLPEVVGDAALLIPPRDTAAMVEALQKLVSDKKLREKLTARGREQARKFSWVNTAQGVLDIYEELLA
jgi:glycosyltransferase involved in cell wall biosynthesis